ncbi:MAG: Ig-like domain-containing protein [candidate division WOR-3 bacterium]
MRFKFLIFTLLLLTTGCDLLLKLLDTTPPVCNIISPLDSTIVSGIIKVQAEAFDSSGITAIDFYADGNLFATESSATASVDWDTRQLPEGSWHKLHCIATDRAGNKGTSDTVNVQIHTGSQRSVFHGKIILNNNYYRWVDFSAVVGETIEGESRAIPGGRISRLSLLDRDNFQKYRAGQTYTALYEQNNITEISLSYQFTADGTYYLVFLNTTGSTQTYWARFIIQ